MQYEKANMNFENLIIRLTFGENKTRPTSLQTFDMMDANIQFIRFLFKNSDMFIILNNIFRRHTKERIEYLINKHNIKVINVPPILGNKNKNSFYKYVPSRIDINKYELFLDTDIVLWKIPPTILKWYNSKDALLINSDWNGKNYGEFQHTIDTELELNAGILGFPPGFKIEMPDIEKLKDKFHSEQGFIVNAFLNSGKKLFVIPKNEIFQTNYKPYEFKKLDNITDKFCGAHFSGNLYAHYFHWDKFYKYEIWQKLYNYETHTNN